ncbi:MAG: outer membrane beta-barrel protein, partial [Vicinamibacterales bacterium]|nr:outer membrane beta-barrel protein [Vicinamibacterales bacterium]
EDCAKDSKKDAKKKSDDSKKKSTCDNGCDGDGDGNDSCSLLQRAMNKTGIGRRLSDAGVKVSGYAQMGYHSDSTGLFNSHPDDFNLHQMYFRVTKAADGSDGIGVGFTSDLVYGVDAQDVQSFGNEDGTNDFDDDPDWDHGIYGWAMPQLYLELAKDDLTVLLGHFYGVGGYEKSRATENFFYSHAKTMYLAEARTLTGIVAAYNVSEELTTAFAWVAGWNTGFDQANDGDTSDGSAFASSIGFEPIEGISLTYTLGVGDLGELGEGYAHSVVGQLEILDGLRYVIQSDMVETNHHLHVYGLNQYVLYDINDTLSAGVRAEWFKVNGVSENDVTFGLNIKPRDCVVIRPEVRTDWEPSAGTDQSIFGIDVILSY